LNISSWTVILLRIFICLGSFSFLESSHPVCGAEPMTWPRFDGPQYNRISRESRFDFQWPRETPSTPDLSNLPLWTLPQLSGNSTPLVFNNKLYLALTGDHQSRKKNKPPSSLVSCWNIKNRDPEFVYQYQVPEKTKVEKREDGKLLLLTEINQPPLLVGDPLLRQLFCLTSQGELHVLDSDLGHLLWKKSLSQIVGLQTIPVSVATPLIFEQCLIISASWSDPDKKTTTNWLLALDRRNGQVVWGIQSQRQSPQQKLPAAIPAVYRNQVVVVAQLEPGKIRLIQIRTGKQIAQWSLADPQVLVQELLFESGGLAVLSSSPQKQTDNKSGEQSFQWWIDLFDLPAEIGSTTTSRTKIEGKAATQIPLGNSQHTTVLLYEKRLFAINTEGILREYKVSSGKMLGEISLLDSPVMPPLTEKDIHAEKADSVTNKKESQPVIHHLLFANQQLLATSTAGLWCRVDVKNSDDKSVMKVKSRQQVDCVLAVPVISKGRIYVRQPESLTAIGPIDNTTAVSTILEPLSILAKEKASTTPGEIIVSPGMQALQPGWKQKFQVQLYNDRGFFLRLLKPEEIQWSEPVLGKFEKKTGTYFAPQKLTNKTENAENQIKAKYKSFSAHATIRIDSP